MTDFFSTQVVVRGDCLERMKEMEPCSIDCILTDSPYGISFMSKHWDAGIPGVEFWRAALRVCKPGAMMLAFGGTRTYHRLACAIEDAGWEIRDCMMWIYGSGFPKSHNVSKGIDKAKGTYKKGELDVEASRPNRKENTCYSEGIGNIYKSSPSSDLAQTFDGFGTALKPAYEPILVCMKPLDGTFAANAQKWGVAGINVDESRVGGEGGRWPANVIFDEVAGKMLDEMSGILKSSGSGIERKNDGVSWKNTSKKIIPNTYLPPDSGGASRFFYCAKASSAERGEDNVHPTVKPTKLLEYLLKLIMPPFEDAVVLDPFVGSGSTLVAAKSLGFNAVGIEISDEYADIAEQRIA